MKIVISYTRGDWDSCYDITQPIEYESCEKLYCDLEEIVSKYIDKIKLIDDRFEILLPKYQKLQTTLRSVSKLSPSKIANVHKINEARDKHQKFQQEIWTPLALEQSELRLAEEKIGNWGFNPSDFVSSDMQFLPPTIETLEEWFNSNL